MSTIRAVEPDAAEAAASAILHRGGRNGALEVIARLDADVRRATLRILGEYDTELLVNMLLEALPAEAPARADLEIVVPFRAGRR